MSLIELELIEELFTSAQKQEIITQLKNTRVMIRNERLHSRAEGVHDKQAETESRFRIASVR
jgi:hypothetical protein